MQHKGLQVAAPQTGMHQVGGLRHQGRDFGAVLASAELGQLVHASFGIGVQVRHRQNKVFARILTPSVILVDEVEGFNGDVARF